MNVNLSELRSKGRISGATLDGRGSDEVSAAAAAAVAAHRASTTT